MAETLAGGCACGAIRYRVTGPFTDSGYCHCTKCRRTSGAPVVAWFTIPAAKLVIEMGVPRIYASSATSRREFCPDCGSQLFFRGPKSEFLDVTSASLDEPQVVPPSFHIWCQDRVAWFEIADALPRHAGNGPDA